MDFDPDPARSDRRRLAVGALGVALLSLAVAAPFWVEPPGRDQGIFLTEGWLALEGASPYTDFWENKPPGIIWVYAGALATFGRSMLSVHLADWLARLVTALLLLAVVRRVTGRVAPGVLAAIAYLAYAGSFLFGGYWVRGQPEIFMDPLVAGALLALIGPRRQALIAGALVGAAVLLKYSALPMIALGAVPWLSRATPRRQAAAATLSFGLGLAAVATAFIAGFALAGTLDALLDATVRFNLAYRDTLDAGAPALSLHRLFGAPTLITPLYAFSAVALLAAAARALTRRSTPADRLVLPALLWWLAASAQVFWQAKFWDYHYHVVLAPLAVLAALGLDAALTAARARLPRGLAPALAVLALLLLGQGYGRFARDYLDRHHLSDRWLGGGPTAAFLATYTSSATDYSYAQTAALAERLAAETAPDDPVFIWGYETGAYFLAQRRPASRFLYDLPLAPAFSDVHADHFAALMADLRAHPPARFVVVTGDINAVESTDSLAQLRALPLLAGWLQRHYEPAWALGDFRVFRPRAPPPP